MTYNMDWKLKRKIQQGIQAYDDIVYRGRCQRCGCVRYVFVEEVLEIAKNKGEINNHFRYSPVGNDVECKGARCKGRCRIKYRVTPFKAVHLNNIRRRNTEQVWQKNQKKMYSNEL